MRILANENIPLAGKCAHCKNAATTSYGYARMRQAARIMIGLLSHVSEEARVLPNRPGQFSVVKFDHIRMKPL
jgi:hypothetical protein